MYAPTELAGSLWRGWSRFWFEPGSARTLGRFRIGLGLVAFLWGLSLAPDLMTFFGSEGLVGGLPTTPLVAIYVVFLIACIALAVGWHSRVAALLVWAGLLFFMEQNPYVFNTGDRLLASFAFLLMLAPSGAAISLDRREKGEQLVSPWPLQLIRLQFSAVYLFGIWEKLRTDWWNDGTAVSYALRMEDYQRLVLPDRLAESIVFSEVLTYGTIVVELVIALGLWSDRWRPWAFASALALHLSIDVVLDVGMFTWIMLLGLMAFPTRSGTGSTGATITRSGSSNSPMTEMSA